MIDYTSQAASILVMNWIDLWMIAFVSSFLFLSTIVIEFQNIIC